ncbi:hypothetical protein D9M72_283250 [compost metagenome]
MVLGPGTDAGEVGTGLRLGHGDGEDGLAACRGRQQAQALLFVADAADIWRHQARMERAEEAGVAMARVFLDQDLLIAEVIDAGAAIFFLGPHQQVALLACLAEHLAVDAALLAPALAMRPDLALVEAAGGFAEGVVFGFEDQALHGWSPLFWRVRID